VQPLNRAEDAIRQAERHRPEVSKAKTNHRRFRSNHNGQFSILDHVQARRQGGSMVAQCPLCAKEGHDAHEDNLTINSDGSKFCCVYGGPNQVHKVRQIMTCLLWQ
jgi:hypothetical protein